MKHTTDNEMFDWIGSELVRAIDLLREVQPSKGGKYLGRAEGLLGYVAIKLRLHQDEKNFKVNQRRREFEMDNQCE